MAGTSEKIHYFSRPILHPNIVTNVKRRFRAHTVHGQRLTAPSVDLMRNGRACSESLQRVPPVAVGVARVGVVLAIGYCSGIFGSTCQWHAQCLTVPGWWPIFHAVLPRRPMHDGVGRADLWSTARMAVFKFLRDFGWFSRTLHV
jgi:hypothetical protein